MPRDVQKQAEDAKELFSKLPVAIRKQWIFFDQVEPDKFVSQVLAQGDLVSSEKRDLFISYLAHRIGYQWYARKSTVTTTPLWDLLTRDGFSVLSRHDKTILRYVAESTPKHAYTLHPKAALATLALWRFGNRHARESAKKSLEEKGIPQTPKFLYKLVSILGSKKREAEVEAGLSLISLATLLLNSGDTDTVALMGGLRLCKVFSPWRVGSPDDNLREASTIASEVYPFESKDWINVIADATLEGKLRSSWMEKIIQAAIRISIADPERADRLRAYHRAKPYEIKREHIDQIYAFELSRIGKPLKPNATYTKAESVKNLTDEFDRCVGINPNRAIALLERVIEETQSGDIERILSETTELDPLGERLLRAYLRVFALDRYAVKFVKSHRNDPRVQDISAQQFENYLVICDYEHSFKNTLVDLAGLQIQHLDKDTAAKVRYFQTSRKDPSQITKLLAQLTGKSDWFFRKAIEAEPIADGVEFVFEQFLERVSDFNFSEEVVRDLKHNQIQIDNWEELRNLPIRNIEAVIKTSATPRIVLAGTAGIASGALGPMSFGLSTIVDTTLLMYMAAEICARYCWCYGFDPRENTDIVAMILGVALKGASIRSVDSQVVRDDLRRFLIYRSVVLGAISNGIALQMMAPFLSAFLTPKKKAAISDFNLALPSLSAGLAMAVNVSLIYDISESARWVLSDRFLARKYEHWNSRF